ncbi:ATP-binding protein [Candidatus Poribacteria bacterium]|nr:ATP-binding protein [Candidatus Poribacteria bacterium]
MAIQINQIKGDIVELIFNPKEDNLSIGENLSLREKRTEQGIIVQVVEFRTVSYPSLLMEQLRMTLAGEPFFPLPLLQFAEKEFHEMRNLNIAIAKIHKLTGSPWDGWNGWIPARDVVVERTNDEEVFLNCIPSNGNMLYLGRTMNDEPFYIEGQALEKVNIITGVKGSGKSHLAKVLLLQLIERGAPCIVFDINREYINLPRHEIDNKTGKTLQRGIIHLQAGSNLKLSAYQFGLQPLLTMLNKFGLPEISSLYFESRMARLFEEIDVRQKMGKNAPFIGIEQLIQMADAYEFAPDNDRINGAIRSRLNALRNTNLFASEPNESVSLHKYYGLIRDGGALVIDISGLSNQARSGFVQAVIEIIKEICFNEIAAGTERFPFLFFEEAHLYVSRNSIDYIVNRSRHIGMTCFFVTNMITGLDEAVLRQADNLFLLNLPFEDDVRHISKSAITDMETMSAFARRLRNYHALVIGNATRNYPLIVKVDPLEGINTAGETKYFFKNVMSNE